MKTKINFIGIACLFSAVLMVASCSKESDMSPVAAEPFLVDTLPVYKVPKAPLDNEYDFKKEQQRENKNDLIRFGIPAGLSINETATSIPRMDEGEKVIQR